MINYLDVFRGGFRSQTVNEDVVRLTFHSVSLAISLAVWLGRPFGTALDLRLNNLGVSHTSAGHVQFQQYEYRSREA